VIKIQEPALALNDIRVAGHIKMSRNIRIRPDDARTSILDAVATVAVGAPGGRLKSLVLNSHGVPGYLIMGEGFWEPHTDLFQRLVGVVDTIWITACRIASRCGLDPGYGLPDTLKGQVGDGFEFCRDIAVNGRCNVVASMIDQDVPNHKIPPGYIDSYEGTVLCFRPEGSIAWSKRYPRHNSE
jgi:hypothetical protein